MSSNPFHLPARLLLALALAAGCIAPAAGQARSGSASALDAARDPRLARRVRLRSEGLPVSSVLRALTAKTRIGMQAQGRAGDERLVAFVPDAPVADVMASIAELFRLTWLREGDTEPPRYRLMKSAAAAREEQLLRDRAFRKVIDELARSLRDPSPDPGPSGRAPIWAPLYRDFIPLIVAREPELRRQGYLQFRIGSLQSPLRERLIAKMAPVLKRADDDRSAALRAIREDEIKRGIPPEHATQDKPPSVPDQSTVTVDLHVDAAPQASVGLRTDGATWYRWINAHGDDLQDEGAAFYRELVERRSDGDGKSALDRVVDFSPESAQRKKDWISALGRISDAAKAPVYADCYHYFNHGLRAPERGAFAPADRGTAAAALDALCAAGSSPGKPASSWWRRGDAALVRSRRWMWEATTVLPAGLLDRLAGSISKSGSISGDDLPALATLNALQVQSLGVMRQHMDYWETGVRLPSRLSATARAQYAAGGITWQNLSPEDRQILSPFLPTSPGEVVPNASGRIQSTMKDMPEQGAPVLDLAIFPPGERHGRSIYIPLPGLGPPPALQPRPVQVELLPIPD